MKLAGHEERMILQLDQFRQLAVGRIAAEDEARLLELLPVGVVEFVAMAMPFIDDKGAIKLRRPGANHQLARLRAQAHGAAFLRHFLLLVQQGNDRMRRIRIEFG